MKRSELIAKVAKRAGLSRASVGRVTGLLFEEIGAEMARAGRVNIPLFGTFVGLQKDRCIRRNPRTGRPFEQAEKVVPKFRPAPKLTEWLKNGRADKG